MVAAAMTDTLARLRQLEAAATPGPWKWRELNSPADADLIIAARNALPRLLDIAEAAPDVLEVLAAFHPMDADEPCHIYEAFTRLRVALAALDSQETE